MCLFRKINLLRLLLFLAELFCGGDAKLHLRYFNSILAERPYLFFYCHYKKNHQKYICRSKRMLCEQSEKWWHYSCCHVHKIVWKSASNAMTWYLRYHNNVDILSLILIFVCENSHFTISVLFSPCFTYENIATWC